MTPDEIREQVAGLPFGPNGKETVAFLMRSRGISLEEAVIELERMAAESGDVWQKVRRQNSTGVR